MRSAKQLSPNQLLLDEQQVAELLGVSRKTIQSWRPLGVGPRWIKLGTTRCAAVRYPRSDLEAWIKAQITGGGDA